MWRFTLATTAGCTAILALAGATGLAVGVIDMGETEKGRMPFDSPVIGGLALALIVGIPMALTGRFAAVGDPRAAVAAMGSGLLLVGWIVMELAFIRTFSWLQPTFAVLGAVVFGAGLTRHRGPDTSRLNLRCAGRAGPSRGSRRAA